MRKIGPREKISPGSDRSNVDVADRAFAQVEREDRLARFLVGRKHEGYPVESARTPERRVDVPGVIRSREDEDAVVVAVQPVQLSEELDDHFASGGLAKLRSLAPERVYLVDEQNARSIPAGLLEYLVHIALALTEPHVQHVMERHGKES